MGRTFIWDSYAIREIIFNTMLMLNQKEVPSKTQFLSIKRLIYVRLQNGKVVSLSAENAYRKISMYDGGLKQFAEENHMAYHHEQMGKVSKW